MVRFAATCTRCGQVLRFEAASLNGAAKVLKAKGWVRPQGAGTLCDKCAPQHRCTVGHSVRVQRIYEIVVLTPGRTTSEIGKIYMHRRPSEIGATPRTIYRNLIKLERSGKIYHVTDNQCARWFPVPVGEAPC